MTSVILPQVSANSRTVIFDLGGTLIKKKNLLAKVKFAWDLFRTFPILCNPCRLLGIIRHIQTSTKKARALARARGEVYCCKFCSYATVYAQADLNLSPQVLKTRIAEVLLRRIEIVSGVIPLIGDLSDQGHTLALLSNTDCVSAEAVRKHPLIYYFRAEAICLSSETKVAKPSPAAFEHLLRSIGTIARRCIFFDDQNRHVRAASAIGIKAYQVFEDSAKMRNILEQEQFLSPLRESRERAFGERVFAESV